MTTACMLLVKAFVMALELILTGIYHRTLRLFTNIETPVLLYAVRHSLVEAADTEKA
jgi:hypothetical protein